MRINGEDIGIVLALLGVLGVGIPMVAPQHTELGWVFIGTAVLGYIAQATHQAFGTKPEDRKPGHVRKVIAFYGMLVSAFAFLSFAAAYFWPPQEKPISTSSEPISKTIVNQQPASPGRSMFDLSDNAQVSVQELHSTGDAQTIARVSGSGKLTMHMVHVVGPNSPPIELPNPTSEVAALSNAQLREAIRSVSAELRAFQQSVDLAKADIEKQADSVSMKNQSPQEKTNDRFSSMVQNMASNDAKYKADFLPLVAQITALVVQRIGPIAPPPLVVADGHDAYIKNRSVRTGLESLRSGTVSNEPVNIANFLDFLSGKLPP